ncbi:hypothetical protein MAF45_05040 [Mesosutterella sp. OilRF-GAM-744-9]|uniref:Uncharacterized protein n=1 Tax=Mesosutterella porci TaxID=2915351 RepID=A0ABS9MQC5_9BURK|nr:hypothetical protein [Mesosutterella sp. oilRF-744-WT-GAM-9]MCG5030811.1 hypothetical protein [Mesosutterella sp. oilRF-744-WT-GAM-9]
MDKERYNYWLHKEGWDAVEGCLLLADIDPDAEEKREIFGAGSFDGSIKSCLKNFLNNSGQFPTYSFNYLPDESDLDGAFSGVTFPQFKKFTEIFLAFWGSIERENTPDNERFTQRNVSEILKTIHFYRGDLFINKDRKELIDVAFPKEWFYEFSEQCVSTVEEGDYCQDPLALDVPIFGLTVEANQTSELFEQATSKLQQRMADLSPVPEQPADSVDRFNDDLDADDYPVQESEEEGGNEQAPVPEPPEGSDPFGDWLRSLQKGIEEEKAKNKQIQENLAEVAAQRDELKKKLDDSKGGAEEDKEKRQKLEQENAALQARVNDLEKKVSADPNGDLGRGVTVRDIKSILEATIEQPNHEAICLPLAAMIEAYSSVHRNGSYRCGTNAAVQQYIEKRFVDGAGKSIFSKNVREAMAKVTNWNFTPGRPPKNAYS